MSFGEPFISLMGRGYRPFCSPFLKKFPSPGTLEILFRTYLQEERSPRPDLRNKKKYGLVQLRRKKQDTNRPGYESVKTWPRPSLINWSWRDPTWLVPVSSLCPNLFPCGHLTSFCRRFFGLKGGDFPIAPPPPPLDTPLLEKIHKHENHLKVNSNLYFRMN